MNKDHKVKWDPKDRKEKTGVRDVVECLGLLVQKDNAVKLAPSVVPAHQVQSDYQVTLVEEDRKVTMENQDTGVNREIEARVVVQVSMTDYH